MSKKKIRKIFFFGLVFICSSFLFAQKTFIKNTVEVSVASFETSQKVFRLRSQGEFGLTSKIFSMHGFGANRSQGFVSVVYHQKDFLPLYLDFIEPFVSANYVHSLSLWVYATNQKGKLYALLHDNEENPFTLFLGQMDFKGWRKWTAVLPPNFIQIDRFAAENRTFRLQGFFYIPASTANKTRFLPHAEIFYLDEITVELRPKMIWQFDENE